MLKGPVVPGDQENWRRSAPAGRTPQGRQHIPERAIPTLKQQADR